ncbi:MAG: shikimate kinase [Silanimonas sp.]|jgi:shikimate kinase|nr:shikimate kinase [Silanimonas sp.]
MTPAANLVLVGPMGAGKTSIGRRLADRFGLAFVDLDQAIEAATGVRVADIFEREGEAGFREREARQLALELAVDDRLVATGGGGVLREANRALMRQRGFVLHLAVPVEEQLRRLANDRSRPLLQRPDREATLRAMAEARAPLYADVADLSFDTRGLTPGQACEQLVPLLRQHWTHPRAA